MVDKGTEPTGKETSQEELKKLGEDIIQMMNERTENPSEAFILLQQLAIYLWDNYRIDWKDQANNKVAPTRRQRYLEFVAGLVDNMTESEEKK